MQIGVNLDQFEGDQRALMQATVDILTAMYGRYAGRYAELVADDISSIEPNLAPYRVDGIGFHLSLIAAGGNAHPSRLDLLSPRAQVYGDCGVVTYTLMKTFPPEGESEAHFATINESRIFARIDGVWKMVHLHKSPTKTG